MQVRNNPEVGAEIMAVLDPVRDRVFAEARAEGRREPAEAYAADALATLVRTTAVAGIATGSSTPTTGTGNVSTAAGVCNEPRSTGGCRAKIIVRVDLAALLRGRPVSGEISELVGYGPVAVSVIRDMIDSSDPFLAAVATRGVDVVGVAHLGRRPTAHQRTALEWLYPTCAVEGCSAVARLEMDHREDWASTHVTLFSLIDRVCAHHHGLKTRENWALVEGRGKRAFVPPTDARHPRNRDGPPASQPPPASVGS